jgi:putative FmdB family regulatory protein
MAQYPYRCRSCEKEFEVQMKPEEVGTRAVECPNCQGKEVVRVYTAFFAKTSRKS